MSEAGQSPPDLPKGGRDLTPLANAVAFRLAIVLRSAHTHGPGSEAWIPSAQGLCRALSALRRAGHEGPVVLEVARAEIAVCGHLALPTFSEGGPCEYLVAELARRGVGALRFETLPEEEEVQSLAYVLSQAGTGSIRWISEELARCGVRSITVSESREPWPGSTTQDPYARAVSVFLQGVDAVREVMGALRDGRSLGLRRCKRFVHAAADLVAVDRSLALSLATIKNYDGYLFNHSVNLCLVSLVAGHRLGLSRRELGELGLAALLRELGKATIPPDLLDKQGSLAPDERARLRRFPSAAVTGLLRARGLNERLLRQVLVTFEHFFRSDAERTLTARDFNLFSKIAYLAGAYDAMTTPRPYRERPLTPTEALAAIVRDRASARIDPPLVKAFLQTLGLYPVGSLLLLDTREIALVTDPPFDHASLARPRVRLLARPDGTELPGAELVDLTAQDADGRFLRSAVAAVDPWRYGINVPRALLGIAPATRSHGVDAAVADAPFHTA